MTNDLLEEEIVESLDRNEWRLAREVLRIIEGKHDGHVFFGAFFIILERLINSGIIEISECGESGERGFFLRLSSSNGGDPEGDDSENFMEFASDLLSKTA